MKITNITRDADVLSTEYTVSATEVTGHYTVDVITQPDEDTTMTLTPDDWDIPMWIITPSKTLWKHWAGYVADGWVVSEDLTDDNYLELYNPDTDESVMYLCKIITNNQKLTPLTSLPPLPPSPVEDEPEHCDIHTGQVCINDEECNPLCPICDKDEIAELIKTMNEPV
jgi:hypothetical protein